MYNLINIKSPEAGLLTKNESFLNHLFYASCHYDKLSCFLSDLVPVFASSDSRIPSNSSRMREMCLLKRREFFLL